MTTLADYLIQQPLYTQGMQIGRQGTQTSPVLSWQEGLARSLQGGLGGLATAVGMQRATDERGLDSKAMADALENFGKGDLAGATKILATRPNLSEMAGNLGMQAGMLNYKLKANKDIADGIWSGLGLGGNATAPATGGGGPYAGGIAGIESAGQPNGGYGAVGPVANQQGGRAYGKYQVLDSNIGPWTQEVLGKAMSPQEFLANPQAQDKVFESKFGQYVSKYGSPQAASRAAPARRNSASSPRRTGRCRRCCSSSRTARCWWKPRWASARPSVRLPPARCRPAWSRCRA